uniref:Putative nuclease HARBI1 n=1 Tax=Romanomermis culicivorax TaxID=13658 RepID=A0A915INX8_ROMCU
MYEISDSSDNSDVDDIDVARGRLCRPRINFDLKDFSERFRFPKETIETILGDIGHLLIANTDRNFPLEPKEQLLLCIRYLASGSFMQVVGDAHGPHKSTVSRKVHKVVTILNNHYFDKIISWPRDIASVVNDFYQISNFPCVIGCVDGTHIPIKAPSINEPQYVNRKGVHSLNCMMICGPDYKFYYVNSRWPGSVNDARVLRTSNIAGRFDNGWRPIPGAVLLGDSGYPNNDWLVTPILKVDALMTEAERAYNRAHKSTRRIIENSFGILKKRFACLQFLRLKPEFSAEVVKLCCILHNMLLSGNVIDVDDVLVIEDDNDIPNIENNAPQRRNFIVQSFNH